MKVAFDRFTFDSDTRELLSGGVRVHLSPKAFDLLRLLLERRPAVLGKAELHERIWPGAFVSDANLSVLIAEIRQVLGDDSRDAVYIRTVHRVGYAFSGAATDHTGRPSGGPSGGPPPLRCWLVWNDQILVLSAGENIIGRDPRCQIWIDATGVSRRHARIAVDAATATIEDLDSSNGTFVAGHRISVPRPLLDRDEIELGGASVTYRVWSDEGAAKTEKIARRRRQ
jgi:DNA-binding winged helix-turn-helix (wHTH) protein